MIDFATLFTRLGKFFAAGDSINTALGTTVPGTVDTALQGLGSALTAEYEAVRQGVNGGLTGFQSAGQGGNSNIVRQPSQNLIRLTTKDDSPANDTLPLAIAELIRQMEENAESLDANTPGASVAYGSGNAGSGVAIVSTKRADGRSAEFIYAEDVIAEVSSISDEQTNFLVRGETARNSLSPLWPGGSGASSFVPGIRSASSGNLVTNGGFEDDDDESIHLPLGWLAPVATLGTTLKLTSVEVQTVAISSTPTAGYYLLHWTNADGDQQTTVPLPYDATSVDVQAALRALEGLEEIEVTSSGTSPDLTHTITFYGVTNPAQLTSTDATTGGAIAHATTTAGSAHVMRGARAVEFDSDAAQLTTIMHRVTLEPLKQYAVNLFAKADVVPAAGVMTVDLVDGVGGTVIADNQGTNNSFTFTGAGLTTSFVAKNGFFRTPDVLPAATFLRIRITTAVSAGTSVYIDEVYLGEATELYTDGLAIAIIDGVDEWEPGDRIVITATNDQAGKIHTWLNRVLGLRESRLLFPTNNAGAETIVDY